MTAQVLRYMSLTFLPLPQVKGIVLTVLTNYTEEIQQQNHLPETMSWDLVNPQNLQQFLLNLDYPE